MRRFKPVITFIDKMSDPFFMLMLQSLAVTRWSLFWRRLFLTTFPISVPLWCLWALLCHLILLISGLVIISLEAMDKWYTTRVESPGEQS